MSVKDPVATPDLRSGASQPGRRGDAVGAEIPVTVHASRSTQGLGKNLPPVHEETRTVIVLQQGAVVRLTASLSTGETVVLTNRVTGADVLCRVGNVKSQPGIQHYVDLEFIQRAPSFWGPGVPAPSASISETPAAVSMPVTYQPTQAAIAPQLAPAAPTQFPAPIAMPATPPPAFGSAVAPSIVDVQPPAETLRPAPLAEPVAVPRNGPHSAVTPIRPPVPMSVSTDSAFGSIGRDSGYTSTGSSKGLMVAAAALLLVVGGAFGGYWFTKRGSAVSPAPQQAASIPQSPITFAPAPAAPVDPAPVSLNTSSPQTQADIFVDSRPPIESATARVAPAPAAPARAVVPAVRRSNVQIGAIKAPTVKGAAARSDLTEPPPMVIATSSAFGDPMTASGLIDSSAGSPAPPPAKSGPALGGQLQPPQLIASTAPVYPATARAQGLQGVVVLDVRVDETGKVVATDVVTGPAPLISAAQEAVRNWKYQAARLNGKPIAINTRVSVRFSLH